MFSITHCRLPPVQGSPANIPINLILRETRVIGLHFAADSMGLSSFTFSWWAPKDACLLKQSALHSGSSRSSKIVNFGTNRKHRCNFLLVINSNLGPIFPRFVAIAGFLFRIATPPLFHPNFGAVPHTLDCRCCGS